MDETAEHGGHEDVGDQQRTEALGPELLDYRNSGVGRLVADVTFTDIEGEEGKLSDYAGRPMAILMHSTDCPVSRRFVPTILSLAQEYGNRVQFLLVNGNIGADVEEVRTALEDYEIDLRYVFDADDRLARELGATTTTEAFVLDAKRTLRYRGAIDDQHGLNYNRREPRMRYLVDALDAVLARRRVGVRATTAPGCDLSLEELVHDVPLTWHSRISRLANTYCQDCHRDGGSAPFPLLTARDVCRRRAVVERVLTERSMPPWFLDSSVGHWINNRDMPQDERDAVLSWLAADCPLGDPENAAEELTWPSGWEAEPDLVLPFPREEIPATGIAHYAVPSVETDLSEERWVQSIEIRSQHPEAMHHAFVFVDYPADDPRHLRHPNPMGPMDMCNDGGPPCSVWIYYACLVPGRARQLFPSGTAKRFPPGAVVTLQVHYTPTGRALEDELELAIVFADDAPDRELKLGMAATMEFVIPAGAPNHEIRMEEPVETDIRIIGLFPHMHYRGKSMRYEVVYPDGRNEQLLELTWYDFDWQLNYDLLTPLDVPAGSKLVVTAVYDNSADNEANPDASVDVTFGLADTDEMAIGYFDYYEL